MVVIDVREPYEFRSGHVSGALNIPLSTVPDAKQLENLDRNEEITVYCNSGRRSGLAIEMLRLQGFNNLKNGINQQIIEMS